MKRMLKTPTEIQVVAIVDHPYFHLDDEIKVVAAVDPKNFNLPDRPVISREQEKIKDWMIDDFESLVSNVEDLCVDYYDLEMTYSNVSTDHSHYYNYLAKDENGDVLVKFRFRLRISNHPAKRSKNQKYAKKQELTTEDIKKLLSEKDLSNIKPYSRDIVVNNTKFDSYEEAFVYIDSIIERAVDVLYK